MTPGRGGEGPSVNLGRASYGCRKYLKLTEMSVQRSDTEGCAGIVSTGTVQPSLGIAPPWRVGRSAVPILSLRATPAVHRASNSSCQPRVVSVLEPHAAAVMALGSLCYSRLDFSHQTPGAGCPGRLWSLPLWRYSSPAWTRCCAACSG